MTEYTVEEFQNNWDELMERVDAGEEFIIVNENGNRAVMVLADKYKCLTGSTQKND